MDVSATVDSIFRHLSDLGRPIASRRRLGVEPKELAERFNSAGLYCHPDVAVAYSVSDGTDTRAGDTIGDLSFFPGYYWLTLDEVFETYNAVKSSPQWRDDWVPVFASGGGDFYAVICSDVEAAFGAIIGFILGEPDQIIEYPTLGAMLEAINQAYDSGAFYVSSEGFHADYEAYRKIAATISPSFVPIEVSPKKGALGQKRT